MGNEMVIGRFPDYSSVTERKAGWEILRTRLPTHIQDQITTIEAPGLKGSIVLAKLAAHPEGVKATRLALIAGCKEIRQAKLQYQYLDETHEIYASPSKPYEQRLKEAKAGLKLDALRLILPADKSEQLEYEISKGRVYLGRTLLASRPGPHQDITYHLPAIQKQRVPCHS